MSSPASAKAWSYRHAWGLAGASFLALYFELLFIRWLPAAVHVLGYFTNLVLIAAFLGMGIGVARKEERPGTAARAVLGVVAMVVVTVILHLFRVDLSAPNREYFLQPTFAQPTGWANVERLSALYGTIGLLFLLTTLAFLPLGQLVGQRLVRLPTLPAYGTNILGSLLGILGFTLLSVLGAPPAAWIAIGLVGLALFAEPRPWPLVLAVAASAFVQGAQWWEARNHRAIVVWSPYYYIRIYKTIPEREGYTVRVNNQFLLTASDLRPEAKPSQSLVSYYAFPYAFGKPQRVLVLGAGAGNDCLAALQNGAIDVTAVEIDPQVARIGRELHPARPLADPHVHVVITDARSFLRSDTRTYDTIIFGTLDSHRLFSTMSSLRMENFVYTVQCFRDAAAHLSPGGVMVVCVGPMGPWVHARIVHTIERATGTPALVYYDNGNLGVVTGPGASPRDGIRGWERQDRSALDAVWREHPGNDLVATDDWPNVFLRSRTIPSDYLVVLAMVLVVSAVFVRTAMPGASMVWEPFFLGAGFLLVETKAITELGLLFGVTWFVSSIVIGTILVVIFAATTIRHFWPIDRRLVYPILIAGLLGGYFFPVWSMAVGSLSARLALSALELGLPAFLAALVFADAFDRSTDVRAAFASNLLGAVAGGVMEYGSLAFGTRFLSLGATLAYGLAIAALYHRSAATR